MIFGNCEEVALEISIKRRIGQWIYGRFLIWLGGRPVGCPEDDGTDLRGCVNWLEKFSAGPGDRCVPDLMLASRDDIWRKLVDPVFDESMEPDPRYGEIFSRFHLSHLGMSAFDKVTLVLIDDGEKSERYLWQQGEEEVMAYTAPLGSLKACAKEAIPWFRKTLPSLPSYDF